LNTWETNITTDEIEPCIQLQRTCVISSQEHYTAVSRPSFASYHHHMTVKRKHDHR
jgi:hypothetical protein